MKRIEEVENKAEVRRREVERRADTDRSRCKERCDKMLKEVEATNAKLKNEKALLEKGMQDLRAELVKVKK